MSTNPISHFQFELFPGAGPKSSDPEVRRPILKDLTLSPENIIVLCIVFVMVLVLFFAFGVERGKKVMQSSGVKNPVVIPAAAVPQNVVIQPRSVPQGQNNPIRKPGVVGSGVVNAGSNNVRPQQPVINQLPQVQERIIDPGYTIQVASFKSPKSAQEEAMNLKQKGFEIYVLPKGSHSIVCVGKFVEMNEAQKFSNKLKNKYKDCLVRRL